MAAEFKLHQHLKMSPNAQIKNLVPENLTDVPPEEEWKLGRLWFNSSIGKLQGVFLKLDKTTGMPVEPNELEVRIVGADALGPTKDGEYWPDGLFDFDEQTKIADAIDEVNEALKDLAPPQATLLNGDMVLTVDGGFKTGRISKQTASAPDQLRMNGVFEGTKINYITTDNSVVGTLPTDGLVVKGNQQQQFGRADQGTISVFFDDVQVDTGIDLLAVFNEDARDYYGVTQGFDPEIIQETKDVNGVVTNIEVNPNKLLYRSPSESLTINTVERYNDFKKWQRGTGTVEFGVLESQPEITPGRHTFFVEHTGIINGPYQTNQAEVFYDPNTIKPTTTITDFSLNTSVSKYVSGVEFKNSGISFSVGLTSTDVFNYTYWDKPISLTASNTDISDLEWNHNDSNLSDVTVPFWYDEFILTNHIVNYTGINSTTESVVLTAKAGKVATGWGNQDEKTINLLVDTNPVSGNSTWLKETFLDEDYRLYKTINFDDTTEVETNTGVWDSEKLLTSGDAQQYMGDLQLAQTDYNPFGANTDYSGFAGTTQNYYRAFKAPNKPNSNGTIKFSSSATFGTDVQVNIKFPGITGWLSLTELYDTQIFTNAYTTDGTGCATDIRKSANYTEIDWTIGTNSTVDSGFGYVLEVIIQNDIKISEIEEISPNWR